MRMPKISSPVLYKNVLTQKKKKTDFMSAHAFILQTGNTQRASRTAAGKYYQQLLQHPANEAAVSVSCHLP